MYLLKLLPRFRDAYRALDLLAEREVWTRDQIEEFQLERLNLIWKTATTHVPYYRQMCQDKRLPRHFSTLAEYALLVPILSKEKIKENPEHFLSENRSPGKWRFTSGSTGVPMRVYGETRAHLERLRCRYRYQTMWGVDIFDPSVFLSGRGATFAPGISGQAVKLRMCAEDYLRNRLRLSGYDLSKCHLHAYLEKITRFRPALLYGYSSAVYVLASEAATLGFHPDFLHLVVLTAEPILPSYIPLIEAVFCAPAIREYGSAEFHLIAYEDKERVFRVREDIVFVETIPEKNGAYKIVISDLINPSFPLLRYDIGDQTNKRLNRFATGFSSLDQVIGRNNDFLQTKSGDLLHPQVIKDMFEHYTDIRRFRAHQGKDGNVKIFIEVQEQSYNIDTGRLKKMVSNKLQGYAADIHIVDTLPITSGGKHRWIISELLIEGLNPSDKG